MKNSLKLKHKSTLQFRRKGVRPFFGRKKFKFPFFSPILFFFTSSNPRF
jgi:hypothetical protein